MTHTVFEEDWIQMKLNKLRRQTQKSRLPGRMQNRILTYSKHKRDNLWEQVKHVRLYTMAYCSLRKENL